MSSNFQYLISWLPQESFVSEVKCLDELTNPGVFAAFADPSAYKIASGFLVLTSQRVMFLKKGNWPAKDYTIQYSVNLEDATVSQGKNRIVILNKIGQKKEFVGKELPGFYPRLTDQISKRFEELKAAKEKERRFIIIDFTSLKEIMAKGGLVMTSLKCPSCGHPQPFPQSGNSFICEYCKTPITAVDVFDKIKGLL